MEAAGIEPAEDFNRMAWFRDAELSRTYSLL
jgi:hypothetical protein